MENKFLGIKIDNPQEPPTGEEIDEIEKLLGVKLPGDFLKFLNYANGGLLNYCIEIAEPKDILSFCSIFSTKALNSAGNPYETFNYEILQYREIFKLPNEVLPFALDGGGSVLFLDLTEKGKGRIVAFIHGLPEWAGGIHEDTFIEIAPTFNDYLGMLFECEDLE